MSKDKKQSVSRFTEEQLTPKQKPSHSYTEGMNIEPLTPLEQKFADAKANRDAGVEPFKMVPVELWEKAIADFGVAISLVDAHLPKMAKHLENTLEKMKQL